MEQDLTPRGGPALGMYGCDREMFERVWQRVMPEERPGCPVTAGTPVHSPAQTPGVCAAADQTPGVRTAADQPPVCGADTAPACGADQDTPAVSPTAQVEGPQTVPTDTPSPEPPAAPVPPAPTPEPPVPAAPEEAERPPEPRESQGPAGDDFPRPDAVPCLGSGSASHGGQLQEDILAALEGWQLYRHLARKVTGGASRTLSALASEKHKQARRLAAAHFLISGVRYWPTDKLETPRFGSWLGTLRRRFAAEQQLDSRWRAASIDTEDACLAVLYGELAEECAAHAGVLRTLLEQAL